MSKWRRVETAQEARLSRREYADDKANCRWRVLKGGKMWENVL